MIKNYTRVIDLIQQASRLLEEDRATQETKSYLALAIGTLLQATKKQNTQTNMRKYYEDKGKKANEEWQKKLKENIAIAQQKLQDETGIAPDSV